MVFSETQTRDGRQIKVMDFGIAKLGERGDLAVLPFDDISPGKHNEFLADCLCFSRGCGGKREGDTQIH